MERHLVSPGRHSPIDPGTDCTLFQFPRNHEPDSELRELLNEKDVNFCPSPGCGLVASTKTPTHVHKDVSSIQNLRMSFRLDSAPGCVFY